MTTISKLFLTALLAIVFWFIGTGIYKAVNSGFLEADLFGGLIIAVIAVFCMVLAIYAIRKIWGLGLVFLTLIFASCNYAKSNQQVVVSDDCGMKWKKIEAGSAVPKGGFNPCYMRVVIPNFPMQGESTFITNLKDKVRATVHIDYDYSITEPLSFISQAKYLGKSNSDPDSDEALSHSAFEGAENMVIDKRIKDVAKRIFITEDLVELDQSDLENQLLTESNAVLDPLGVHLNFITLTFDLDEQTRQAIDISTAMKIYESKGLNDIGKEVMINRAGATKIIVEGPTIERVNE